jgi:hypothetical protein
MKGRRRSALWRDGDFRRLWVGQAASQLGAQASQVTLPLIAVAALNADAGQLGAVRAVEQAPILLFSLFVGAWVDRRRSRSVMVLADFGRGGARRRRPVRRRPRFGVWPPDRTAVRGRW